MRCIVLIQFVLGLQCGSDLKGGGAYAQNGYFWGVMGEAGLKNVPQIG